MQTCDLRETGSSGEEGVRDRLHPRTDIMAEEQSKGWKEGEVPQGQWWATEGSWNLSCGPVCHNWKGTGGASFHPAVDPGSRET